MSTFIGLKVSSVLILTYIIPALTPLISFGLMCSGEMGHCGT